MNGSGRFAPIASNAHDILGQAHELARSNQLFEQLSVNRFTSHEAGKALRQLDTAFGQALLATSEAA